MKNAECQVVDVHDDYAGRLSVGLILFCGYLLLESTLFSFLNLLGNFQILSLFTVFFLESSFSFTVFCLNIRFEIFIYFFYFKVIHEQGLRYRCTAYQVGMPNEKALVFKVREGFSNFN